jgi:hypothetical protein
VPTCCLSSTFQAGAGGGSGSRSPSHEGPPPTDNHGSHAALGACLRRAAMFSREGFQRHSHRGRAHAGAPPNLMSSGQVDGCGGGGMVTMPGISCRSHLGYGRRRLGAERTSSTLAGLATTSFSLLVRTFVAFYCDPSHLIQGKISFFFAPRAIYIHCNYIYNRSPRFVIPPIGITPGPSRSPTYYALVFLAFALIYVSHRLHLFMVRRAPLQY